MKARLQGGHKQQSILYCVSAFPKFEYRNFIECGLNNRLEKTREGVERKAG